MRSTTALIAALWGSLGPLSAVADDTPIAIQTDLEGQYFLVDTGGTEANPTLVVKRAAPGYTHYIKREFDCAARTVRYLGGGESLEALNAAQLDTPATPIKAGTIPDQLARLACPKP
jgi:hypothetical protein